MPPVHFHNSHLNAGGKFFYGFLRGHHSMPTFAAVWRPAGQAAKHAATGSTACGGLQRMNTATNLFSDGLKAWFMAPCTRTISPDQPGSPSQQLHEVLIAEKTVFKNILKVYLNCYYGYTGKFCLAHLVNHWCLACFMLILLLNFQAVVYIEFCRGTIYDKWDKTIARSCNLYQI